MRFNDRPKVTVDIAADGQIEWATPSAIDGYNDISWSAEYAEVYPYLLTQGSNYEFGYLTWYYDAEATPMFTNSREVIFSNVGGGTGFPSSTAGLTMSFVAGKHNFVSSTAGTSNSAPETGGSGAFAVGPGAKALVDYSAAVGVNAEARAPNSMAVGNQAKTVRPYEFSSGPPAPVREASFGVAGYTGINETTPIRQTSSESDFYGDPIDFGTDPLGGGALGVVQITLDLFLTPSETAPASLADVRIVQVTFTIGHFAPGTSVISELTVVTKHAGANVPALTYTATVDGDGSVWMSADGVANINVRGIAKVQRIGTA